MGAIDVLSRKTGVIVGDDVYKLFKYCQEKNFAIPAINVTSSSTVVASLEAARDAKSPVILQVSQGGADHCAKKLLPWLDGMLDADESYFKLHGEPLFSSHMIDLSEEEKEWNINTTAKYSEAISYGIVKVNLDTDLQWAYLTGVRDHVLTKKDYLASQVGNPEGEGKPNKKYYDPRVWVREGEKTMTARVKEALEDFNTASQL
ncbi:MAG: hypothetical protein Q9167_004796 [Letrouitia subvulpina]